MTPYVTTLVNQEDRILFEKIRSAVCNLPDLDFGVDEAGEKVLLSCHMLARAVATVFFLRIIDGYFRPNFQHSWIETSHGNVIDVYPVGMLGGPILVYGNLINGVSKHLYFRKSTRAISGGRFNKPWFRNSVKKVTAALVVADQQAVRFPKRSG